MKNKLIPFLLLIPLVALADTDPDVAAGNTALQNNKPEEALAHYQKAEATLAGNADLSFNKGGALFAQKKFEEAATQLLSATSSKESIKRAEAYRHYGDALFRQENIDGAIQAYIQALTLNPNDDVAKHNLEVALGKQQPQSQPQSQESQDPQSQPQSQQSESQPSSQQNQQEQQNQDGQEKDQKQQSGQEDQEKKEDQKEQGAQNQEQNKEDQEKQQQAQQGKENQEQPKEPEDKLLDALRAKEKSFLHAKKKGKGNTPPNVTKDW